MMHTKNGILVALAGLVLSACGAANLSPHPEGAIIGTVTSPQLGPLALDVLVTASGGAGTDTVATDPTTGAFGAFHVVAGGVTVAIAEVHLGCTLPTPQPISLSAGDTVTADMAVDCTGALVRGHVTSATLGALSGVTIAVTTNGNASGTTVTDRAGVFTFDSAVQGAGAGPWTIGLSVTNGLPGSCGSPTPLTLSLSAGGTIEPIFNVVCS
jgi:hypothetical protein